MGWREVLGDALRPAGMTLDDLVAFFPAMPPADRIALARELLGTSEGVDAALATVRKAAAVYRKQPFGTDECALAWEQFNLALGALMSECMAFAKDSAP